MSEKKNTKKEQQNNEAAEKKKLGKKGILAIILSSVALVGIIVGIFVGVAVNKNKEFDYNKAKLSKYVSVPERLYKSYNVTLNIPEITDFDVEEEVVKVLCANKITPDGPIYSLPGIAISAGDIVRIYYRGYTMEDDVKKYFDGGCNFASDPADTELEIGSGTFVPGFESGLIGEDGVGKATLTRAESGKVRLGDIISLTYSVFRSGGTSQKNQTVLIDLSDPTLDERWGTGFTEYLVGRQIGTDNKFGTNNGNDKPFIVDGVTAEGGTVTNGDVYMDMSVSVACRVSSDEKLVIPAYFPNDYQSEDLQGKTAYFEIYIDSVRDYTTPDFNDEFITETLKFTAEDLSKFEGENLTDKYKEYLKAMLNEERDAEIKYAIEDAFWAQLMEGMELKKLPESEVTKYYNMAVADLEELFNSGYGTYYNNDFDAFARSYLELSSTGDWKATLRKDAEQSVQRRLAFYYIVREEELYPSEEEYNRIYKQIFADSVQEYLDYYGITENSADYEARLEEAKNAITESYDENYWDESVLYEYVIAEMLDRANVSYE